MTIYLINPEFSVESLYLRVNDSRFTIDHEAILNELDSYRSNANNLTKSGILLIIKCLTSIDQLLGSESSSSSLIWLNVTCEDNYLFSRYNKDEINSKSILIKLNVTKSELEDGKNDLEYPKFEKPVYALTIYENWTGLLTKLNALNSQDLNVSFSLVQKTDQFKILNENEPTIVKPADYDDNQRVFNFTIKAENLNNSSFSSYATVLVLVQDLDDNTPMFLEKQFNFTLSDQIPSGFKIGSLYAIDLDSDGDNLTFKLLDVSNNDSKFFDLKQIDVLSSNMRSGLKGVDLVFKQSFNSDSFQQKDHLEFRVQIIDKALHKSTCQILINILNSMDDKTEIGWISMNNTNIYRAVVKENSEEGTFVAQVLASSSSWNQQQPMIQSIYYYHLY
jgi:hypothetical protein